MCPHCGGAIHVTAQKPFFDIKPVSQGGPRFPALVGPARIGKTRTGAAKLISYAIEYPAKYFVGAPTYQNHMKIATLPTYENLLEYAIDIVDLTDDGRMYHKTDQCIRLKPTVRGKPGSRIDFRTVDDPGRMWGAEYAAYHLDEAGQMAEEVPAILEPRLTAQDGPRQGIATFTPRGDKRHWTWRYYGRQYEQAIALAEEWKTGWVGEGDFPVATLTIEQNPWLDPGLLKHLKEQAKGSALRRQEYYGEWFESGGVIYEDFDPNLHVRYLPKDAVIKRVAAGVDFGLSAPTVIIVVGEDQNGRLWWLHEFYQPKCDWRTLVQECDRLRMLYPAICFYCDPNGKTEIKQLRMPHGFPAFPANNEVNARVTRIWDLLSRDGSSMPGMFVTPGCSFSISEFLGWSWKEGKGLSGNVMYDQVEPHAHCLDAGGYATVALLERYDSPMPVQWGRERVAV